MKPVTGIDDFRLRTGMSASIVGWSGPSLSGYEGYVGTNEGGRFTLYRWEVVRRGVEYYYVTHWRNRRDLVRRLDEEG